MSLWRDIAQTYVAPGRVIRRLHSRPVPDRSLLVYLMAACAIAFIARLPGQVAQYHPTADAPVEAFFASALVAGLIFAPLLFYILALIGHAIARLAGGTGNGQGARLALFWPLLALQPFVILIEIIRNLAPDGLLLAGASGAVGLWFLALWAYGLWIVEA